MVLKITVKTLDSQNYELEAQDTWTVQQFKDHIQPTVNVSANEQRLIFCGRVLQDDKKLTEYDCNGKVVHLVRRPPPSLDNNSATSGAAPADSNNNNNSGNGNPEESVGENARFLDESNVLFSALTLGPEANMNHILRHILTLQQAIYTRNLGDGTPVAGSPIEPLSMTDIDRHLHNAARLLRITINTINECMARIAALPPTGPRPSSNQSSTLETPRPVITAASSHTELHRDDEMQTSDTNDPSATSSTISATATTAPLSTTVDDISVGSIDEDTPRRTERPDVPRQSLTTDDLPQSANRAMPQFPPPSALRPQYARRGTSGHMIARRRSRQESELECYMTILNYSCDLQNQFQGLARRYRHLIDISRRGGLIVPRASTSTSGTNSTSGAETSASSENQPRQGGDSQVGPMSLTLMNETRILGLYIPRIMHHISHLQHALSDFQVDFTRGRLMLCASSGSRAGHRETARRSNPPSHNPQANSTSSTQMGSQNSSGSDQPQASMTREPLIQNQTLESTVTITATATEATPILTTTTTPILLPQANATIVVTSEPIQGGAIRIPLSIPISMGSQGSISMDFTTPIRGHPMPTAGERQPTMNQQQHPQQQQQQTRASAQATTSNSTQTVNRPIGVISGRIPLPFDYYLPCFSPWANYSVTNRPTARASEATRVQFRTTTQRPQATPPVPPTSANSNTAQNNIGPSVNVTTQGARNQITTPVLDMGLTEVVTSLVGSIFRPQQRDPNAPQGANPTANQDPLFNIIPELALNAASQILGGVFGNQNATTNIPSNNQQTGRSQQTTTASVLMDIDIDDSSSSQSESRYQDAQETQPLMSSASNQQPTQHTAPTRLSSVPDRANTSTQPNPIQSSSAELKYDRQHLVEVMQNHPDWIPIIEADIGVMEQQQRVNTNQQPFFSDAYLSSIPRKRRRLLTTSPDCVLILQPSPSQAISNLLRRAIVSSSSSNIASIDQVLNTIASDQDLQSAYEDYIKSAVEARLTSDYDYCPQKFANSSKYFKK